MAPGSSPISCSRCFKVFDAPEARAAVVPLCAECAALARASLPDLGTEGVLEGGGRRRVALAVVVGVLVAGALVAFAWLRRPAAPPPPTAGARVEDRVAGWRAAGLVPATAPADAAAHAAARAREGREGLSSDLPGRERAGLAAFREAVAADPTSLPAAVGFAEAVADLADEDADAEELRAAHEVLDAAAGGLPAGGRKERATLDAARARLLLLVESEANSAEALRLARAAALAAPDDPAVVLAAGLSLAPSRPGEAAAALEKGFRADPSDRRLLTAAAAVRRRAGDAQRAPALAAERLALDPGHPASLRLTAELQEEAGRFREARDALERWRTAEPGSHLPPLRLARLAYQVDGDLASARRLLDEATGRAGGEFARAHVLAHRAAVEREAGELAAAQAASAEALKHVPGDGPARFQAALLAWRARDRKALAESAGVLGDRAGKDVAHLLAVRAGELSGTSLEAYEAWRAAAGAGPHDPWLLLALAASLQRGGASGPALELARDFLEADPLEVRLPRVPGEFFEGAAPAAEACARLEAIGRAERGAAATAFAAAAACELAFGRPQRAEALARAAVPHAPRAAAPLWIRAQAALERGKARPALQLADDAVEADPTSPVAREVRARVLEALKRRAEATREHEAAAGSGLVTARLARARSMAREGRVDEARRAAAQLAAARPGLVAPRAILLDLPGP